MQVDIPGSTDDNQAQKSLDASAGRPREALPSRYGAGSFTCGNDLLNRLHDTIRWTQQANALSESASQVAVEGAVAGLDA